MNPHYMTHHIETLEKYAAALTAPRPPDSEHFTVHTAWLAAQDEAKAGLPEAIAYLRQLMRSEIEKHDEWSERAYFESVEATAKEIFERCVEENPDDPSRCDWQDWVHEDVDGSAWVIYYHAAAKTLLYSDNDDAIFDAGVGLEGIESCGDFNTKAAYFAMEADVSAEVQELFDDYEPPVEEDEEDEEEEEPHA